LSNSSLLNLKKNENTDYYCNLLVELLFNFFTFLDYNNKKFLIACSNYYTKTFVLTINTVCWWWSLVI